MAYRIQKLGLGGILDQAVSIVRDNFGLLFGILLYLWLPYQIIASFIGLAIQSQLPANPTPEDIMRVLAENQKYFPLTVGLSMIGLVIVLPLTNAAIIYAVAEKYLGKTCTPGEALKFGASRIGALVWTAILMGAAIMGGLILLIIPGILCALWFGLAQHVVVLEGRSGGAALSRSKALVGPNMGMFLILGIVIFLIAFLLGGGAGLVPQIHVRTLLSVLINAGITLFSTAAFVVFYFSCRCSVENFDLEHLAASVEGGAPPADPDLAPELDG